MPDLQRPIPRAPRLSLGAAAAAVLLAVSGAWAASMLGGIAGLLGGALLACAGITVVLVASAKAVSAFEEETFERADLMAVELEDRRRTETRLRAEARCHKAARAESERQRREAESADRAKTAFLSNLSRELRTPLNNVLGLAGILLDTRLSESQADYARTIHGAAEALISVVDDILDLSRLDDGDLDLDRREFELGYCVEGVIESFAGRAKQRELDVELQLDPTIPAWLSGDRRRLRQVLLALLGRAAEHATDPALRLSVSLEETLPDRVTLLFEITGVAEAKLGAEVGKVLPGTAASVSMSLAVRLVERMGGSLTIDPSGEWTTFTVQFENSARASAEDAGEDFDLGDARMLLVRGSEECEAPANATANALGMRLDIAETGTDGLNLLKESPEGQYAVVLIDADLPDIAGTALAGILRGLPECESVGCILLRSAAAEERPDELARLGFDAWIKKPISETRLRTAVLHVTADPITPRDRTQAQPASEPAAALPKIGSFVLLAEDNLVNQKVTGLMLQRLGCSFETAVSGMQAIEQVMAHDFDVVLMDCSMPELDGFEATRAIRRLSDRVKSQIPIIALTASAEDSDVERCLEAGMNAHMAKPVRTSDLARLLQHWSASAGLERKEPSMSESFPIDPEVLASLKELGGDDPSIFVELVDLFLSDTPERMRELEDAHQSGDPGAIEASAHALKSSCGNLGAMGLYEMFRDIEARGRTGDVDTIDSLISSVRNEFSRVEEALRREIA